MEDKKILVGEDIQALLKELEERIPGLFHGECCDALDCSCTWEEGCLLKKGDNEIKGLEDFFEESENSS